MVPGGGVAFLRTINALNDLKIDNEGKDIYNLTT